LIFGKQRLEQIFAEWGGDFKAGAGVTSFGWGCHNLEFQFFNRDSFGCMVCVRVYSHPCLNDRQAVCESFSLALLKRVPLLSASEGEAPWKLTLLW